MGSRANIRPFWTLVWSFFVVFYTFLFGRQASFKGHLLYFLISVTTQLQEGRYYLGSRLQRDQPVMTGKSVGSKQFPWGQARNQRQVNGRAQLGPTPSLVTVLRGLAHGLVLTHPRWLSPFSQSFDSTRMETPREVPHHLLGDSKSSQVGKEE